MQRFLRNTINNTTRSFSMDFLKRIFLVPGCRICGNACCVALLFFWFAWQPVEHISNLYKCLSFCLSSANNCYLQKENWAGRKQYKHPRCFIL